MTYLTRGRGLDVVTVSLARATAADPGVLAELLTVTTFSVT